MIVILIISVNIAFLVWLKFCYDMRILFFKNIPYDKKR